MKKTVFILFILTLINFTYSFIFAANSDLQYNAINNKLLDDRQSLIDNINLHKSESYKNILEINKKLDNEKGYNILIDIGKLSPFDVLMIDDISNKFKSEVLLKYSNLSSQLSLLKDKLLLELIDNLQYVDGLTKIENELSIETSLFQKNIKDSFYNIYDKIDAFSGSYISLLNENKTLINQLIEKEKNLNELLNLSEEFFEKINNINSLYNIKNSDIYSFLEEVTNIIANTIGKKLYDLADENNIKYPNLTIYRSEINKFIDTKIDSLKIKLKEEFENLVGNIYSQEDLDFIKVGYNVLKDTYLSGNNVLYSKILTGSVFDEYYNNMNSRLSNSLSGINIRLNELEDAYSLSELKEVLTKRFQEFADNKYIEDYNDVRDFLKNKRELIDYQISKDKEKYDYIIQSGEGVSKLLGKTQKKYDSYTDLYNYIKENKDKFIDKNMQKNLELELRKIEYQRTDLRIYIDKLNDYMSKYPGIENRLELILTAIYEEYNSKGKGEDIIKKYESMIGKIDAFLEDEKLSESSKYVLLEIKKSAIKFLYLK